VLDLYRHLSTAELVETLAFDTVAILSGCAFGALLFFAVWG
jgi:hypothetical protein